MQEKKRKNLKIAVIETEPVIAAFIRQCLNDSDYTITAEYNSVKAALLEISDSDIDLIIMDVLPEGSHNKVKEIERIMIKNDFPIIFITGKMDDESMDNINYFDYHVILRKSFTRDDLLNSIEKVYLRYIKSLKFYRDCRRLILDINPYKSGFMDKIDSLMDIINDAETGKQDFNQIAILLADIKVQMQMFIISDKATILRNKQFKSSVFSIAKYADFLLNEVDSLNIKEIKNSISYINIYLRVLLTSCEGDDTKNNNSGLN